MDNIVFTVTGKLQELLLRVDGLTVEKAVKVCRAYEQSTKQVKEFRDDSNPSNSSTKVNQVAQKPERQFCNYLYPPEVAAPAFGKGMRSLFLTWLVFLGLRIRRLRRPYSLSGIFYLFCFFAYCILVEL